MNLTGFYRGVVVRNEDPQGMSRVQLRVPQVLGPVTTGWALPMMLLDSTLPSVGEQVWATFEGGDESYPMYLRQGRVSSSKRGTAPRLAVSSSTYRDRGGVEHGQAQLSWTAVKSAIDGTDVTAEAYRVEAMLVSNSSGVEHTDTGWAAHVDTAQLQARTGPFDIGSVWKFRVSAKVNHAYGTWSPEVALTFAADPKQIVPPSVPAVVSVGRTDPTTGASIGSSLQVTWDGLDANGNALHSGSVVQMSVSSVDRPGDILATFPAPSTVTVDISGVGEDRSCYVFLRAVPAAMTEEGGVTAPNGDSSAWGTPAWVWAALGGEPSTTGVEVNDAGDVKMTAASTAPAGWMFANGPNLLRAQYPRLFRRIGTSCGTPSDADHFYGPDIKGKVVVGRDPADPDFDTVGETGGLKDVTLGIPQIPTHNHALRTAGDTASGNVDNPATPYLAGGTSPDNEGYGISWWDSANTLAIANAGDGEAHENMPPYTVLNYIFKL